MTGTSRTSRLSLAATLLAALLVPLTATPAAAVEVTFTVDWGYDAIDSDPGDGICDDGTGACTLRAAVMEASASDNGVDVFTIHIETDTVTLDIPPATPGSEDTDPTTGDLDIVMSTPLTIEADLGVPLAGAPDGPTGEPGALITTDPDFGDRLFEVVGSTLHIEALNLSEGHADGARTGAGGAIFATAAAAAPEVYITESRLHGHVADIVGGAVYVEDGVLDIRNAEVFDNRAGLAGGGIACDHCALTVDATVVTRNESFGDGGGLAIAAPIGADATISNSEVSLNLASLDGAGGGIWFAGEVPEPMPAAAPAIDGAATLTIQNTLVGGSSIFTMSADGFGSPADHGPSEGNAAGRGGGIAVAKGNLVLDTDTVVAGNFGFEGGGIAALEGGVDEGAPAFHFGPDGPEAISLDGAVVTNNQAAGSGGGILMGAALSDPVSAPASSHPVSSLTATDAAIVGNVANGGGCCTMPGIGGGGIASFGADVTVAAGSLVADNSTAGDGGGIYTSFAVTTVSDSLVVENWAGAEAGGAAPAEHNGPYGDVGGDGGGIYQFGGQLVITDTPADELATVVGDNVACPGHDVAAASDTECTRDTTVLGGAEGRGGGIYVGELGSPTLISGATISGNAGNVGGGLWMGPGDVVQISESTIEGNDAHTGGGIYNRAGDLTVTASLIGGAEPVGPENHGVGLGNRASADGGGIYATEWGSTQATTTLDATRVLGNHAGVERGASATSATGFGDGGAIYNGGSILTISDSDLLDAATSEISDNVANDGSGCGDGCGYGGGIYTGITPIESTSTVEISDTLLHHNRAHEGGALWLGHGDDVTVLRSTFTHNWADVGGATYQEGGSLTIAESTLGGTGELEANGTWQSDGGAIWADLQAGGGGGGGGAESHTPVELRLINTDVIGNEAWWRGGGVFVWGNDDGSTPSFTVFGGEISDNKSGVSSTEVGAPAPAFLADGAGIWLGNGNGDVNGTTLARNEALGPDAQGGGIYLGGGSILTVADAAIDDNRALRGGGLYLGSGDLADITGSSIDGNTVTSNGGGLYLDGAARLLLDASSVSGNTAQSGGGLYQACCGLVGTDVLAITDSTFADNIAEFGDSGGGIYLDRVSGTHTIDGSTFVGNTTDGAGGGIWTAAEDLRITNSTFTANEAAGNGGAIYTGGAVDLVNVTVAGNTTTSTSGGGEGGGLGATFEVTFDLKNTIVADNVPLDCDSSDPALSFVSLGYNLDSDGTCLNPVSPSAETGDLPGVDAMLGALADNGGPTETMALLIGSPAIDSGDDVACAEDAGGVDQRGVERPLDGDGDGPAVCDMGAYERGIPVASLIQALNGSEQGPAHGVFSLALDEASPDDVVLDFTIDGTATRGSDYTLNTNGSTGPLIGGGQVTIPAGSTLVDVFVTVIDDSLVENPETVIMTLTGATGAVLGSPTSGTSTISDNDTDDDGPPAEGPPVIEEPGGDDRIETAIEVAGLHFTAGSAPTIIIARSDEYADALTGGPLAAHLGGPILLTPSGGLDGRVAAFIDQLGSTEAYLLGGTVALTPNVEAGLRAAGIIDIVRIAGENRFETAGDIARFLEEWKVADAATARASDGSVHVYVAEGISADPNRGWPDPLSVSALAAQQQRPILLVRNDAVPRETADALGDISADDATIVGGPVAVSPAVETQLGILGLTVDRVGGADRYETSAMIADLSKAEPGTTPEFTWLATGLNFPDAIVAGPAVSYDDGILLLVHGTDLRNSLASEDWLRANKAAIRTLRFLGGVAAITENVREQVRAAIS